MLPPCMSASMVAAAPPCLVIWTMRAGRGVGHGRDGGKGWICGHRGTESEMPSLRSRRLARGDRLAAGASSTAWVAGARVFRAWGDSALLPDSCLERPRWLCLARCGVSQLLVGYVHLWAAFC